jgi:hypothetical protein
VAGVPIDAQRPSARVFSARDALQKDPTLDTIRIFWGLGLQPQHPPSDAPAISVRFAEPPSDEGTAGGQVGEEALGAVAVVLAA